MQTSVEYQACLNILLRCSLSSAKIQKISINAIVMNEKVLILLNTTILTENTELGDEGGEDKKSRRSFVG